MTGTIFAVCFLGGVAAQPSRAQDLSLPQDEIKAVFRISREFVKHAIDQEELVANIPIRATIIGLDCSGVIRGRGKLSVELQGGGEQATLIIRSKGKGAACITGVRRRIVAKVPSGGPFTTCSILSFDGRHFSRGASEAHADVHLQLQRITTRRDKFLGRTLGALAKPVGKRMMPRTEPQAKRVTERAIVGFVNSEMDKALAKLNEHSPVDDTVNRLFPDAEDWKFYLGVEGEFIQAAFGPAGLGIPTLPELPTRSEDAVFEAWLRSTSEEATTLEDLSKRPLAKRLVQTYLESTLPKLAALTGERSITAVGPWVVIDVSLPEQERSIR